MVTGMKRGLLRLGLKAREWLGQAVGNHEQVTSLAMVRAAIAATTSSGKTASATFQRISPPLLVGLAAYHTRWRQPQSRVAGAISITYS